MQQLMDYSMYDPATTPEQSVLDRERKDLLDKQDMLQIFRFILDDPIPKENIRPEFFITASKQLSTSFLNETDEFFILNSFDLSNIIYSMQFPRSEKTVAQVVANREMRTFTLASIRRSQGFKTQRVNLMSLFSTIFKHNIHSMTESGGGGGGIFGAARRFMNKY